jgi:hypothetical protein
MASIFLPLVAVKAGQNLFSLFGVCSKNKISVNAEEQIVKLAQEYVANGQMRAHRHNDEECVNDFLDIVINNRDYKKQKKASKNPFKKAYFKILDQFDVNKKENVEKFAKEKINELINIRKNLLNPNDEFKKSKHFINFNTALEKGQTKNVAVKSVLDKFLKSKSLNSKFVKTIGGFAFLGLAIKPIDKFVDEVLIGKVVGPTIDKKKST